MYTPVTASIIFAITLTGVIALDDLGGDGTAFLQDIVDQRSAGLSIFAHILMQCLDASPDRL
jgi:hypothetical protein